MKNLNLNDKFYQVILYVFPIFEKSTHMCNLFYLRFCNLPTKLRKKMCRVPILIYVVTKKATHFQIRIASHITDELTSPQKTFTCNYFHLIYIPQLKSILPDVN